MINFGSVAWVAAADLDTIVNKVRFVPVQMEDVMSKVYTGQGLSLSYRLKRNLDNLIAVMVQFHARRCKR